MSGGTPFSSNGQELFTDNNPASVKLKTGNSTIGKVTFDSLPAGTNYIGDVALRSGSYNNIIGKMAIAEPTSGSTAAVGNLTVASDGNNTFVNTIYSSAYQQGFNGSTWDRWRNNVPMVVLPTAKRTASINTPLVTNHNAKGMIVYFNVTAKTTAASPTVTLKLRTSSPNGEAQMHYLASFDITNVGIGAYSAIIYPGSTGGTTLDSFVKAVIGIPVPRIFDIQVIHNADITDLTYSLSCSFIL